ncbi:MAG TPA: hypothetical protein VGI86_03320, partial [Acidimicrobiia bacterium]
AAILLGAVATACSGGGSSSKAAPRVAVPKGATSDPNRLLDTQWALQSVQDERGRALLTIRADGPSPGVVAFPYRGSGLPHPLTTASGPKPIPRFSWEVCSHGTGPLRASKGTIDTKQIVVTRGWCGGQYPYMANRPAAQAGFTDVLTNRSHRVVWFVDESGHLHLVSPFDGESLIFGQSMHG